MTKKGLASEYEEVLRAAIATYGANNQIDMAIEEMSELIKALLKYRRAENSKYIQDYEGFRNHVCEEIADVIICIDQLRFIFDCHAEVDVWRRGKTERLAERIYNDTARNEVAPF